MRKGNQKKEIEQTYKSGEVMSMLENMNDGIRLIAEGQSGIVDRLDSMEGKVDSLETRFDSMETRFDSMEGKVDSLETRFDSMETRFDSMETRFDSMETRFDSLEGKVDRLQDDVTTIKHKLSEKVDKDDFDKLEKRLLKVERLVFSKLA